MNTKLAELKQLVFVGRGVCAECHKKRLSTVCIFYPCTEANPKKRTCASCLESHYAMHTISGQFVVGGMNGDLDQVAKDLEWAKLTRRLTHGPT